MLVIDFYYVSKSLFNHQNANLNMKQSSGMFFFFFFNLHKSYMYFTSLHGTACDKAFLMEIGPKVSSTRFG